MNFWNVKAAIYQRARQLPGFSHILNAEINNLKSIIKDVDIPKHILDIGIGTGATHKIFDDSIHICGLDLSFKMLEQAKRLNTNLDLIQGLATELPIQNSQVSFLCSIGLTEYIDDLTLLLEEMNRALKPKGYILITMAPKSIFNQLRLIWGSRLFLRSNFQWDTLIEPTEWQLIKKSHSLLQMQYLYQKL